MVRSPNAPVGVFTDPTGWRPDRGSGPKKTFIFHLMRREEMVGKKILGIAVVFSIVAALSIVGCAQRPVQSPTTGVMKLEGTKVTVKGKIGYMKSVSAYVIHGEAPPDELFIVNPDPKILETLMKSGKTVTIEGHYTIGADHLFIEKIDGKAYQGKE
jgi:hypothetical protein